MSNKQILIIGGGLTGLALAQGLKKAGVAFIVFERDQAASFRSQGYRIRVNQVGGDSLQKVLPASLFEQFERSCADVVGAGHQLNAALEHRWGQ